MFMLHSPPEEGFLTQIPFTVYDLFAYVSAGSLLVGLVDLRWGPGWLAQDLTAPRTAALTLAAYLVGHVVAQLSSLVIENGLIARVLGKPSENLMASKTRRWRWIFPLYFRPLTQETQERIRKNARARGFSGEGEALFSHVFSVVGNDERLQAKLDQFLNLYGFSRNMAFVLVASSLVLLGSRLADEAVPLSWPIGAGVFGVIFLYRYLKFFRQYSYRLLLAYSERQMQ